MDPTTLLNRPKTLNIIPKITKINNLSIASGQARKSSTKLVKVFEKGTYQKKTQLSVLNRYKRRLESIQKQNDRAFGRKRKVKVKMPDIKKYVGSFFTPGSTNDPLKAIGALAAWNSLSKGSKGDWGGALGSGLVAFGLLGGGAAGIKMARAMFKGGATPAASGAGGGGVVSPPWWMKNTKSLGRANESYGRYIAGEANIGDRARLARRGMIPASGMFSRGGTDVLAKQAGKPLAKEALGRFGKSIIPGIGAAFSFQSAKERDKAGDKFGSAVDNIAGSLDAFAAGVQIAAGASAATGIGIPAAGIIELAAGVASIGSFGLDMFNLVRDITGQSDKETQKNKLQQQTEQQKALVEKKKDQGGKLTFSKTLNSYGRAVAKFEEFAKGFTGGMGMTNEMTEGGNTTPPPAPVNPYTGPISKDSFFPLPGGTLSTAAVGVPGGEYGAQRSYEGGHGGQDIGGLPPGSPVVAWKTGTVTIEPGYEGGDSILSIDHGNGIKTVYKHIVPTVRNGDTVYGGQQIATLWPGSEAVRGRKWQTHLHFEVWNGNSHINPNQNLSASQRISSPMTIDRAKEISSKNSTPQSTTPTGAPPGTPETLSPLFQRQQPSGLSIGQGGFRVNGTAAANLSQSRSRRMPAVSQNLPYQEGYSQTQPTIVPYPVVRQQQAAASAPSAPMMFPGPSEQQLLNSFYKKVLLNTVQ